MNRYLSLTLLLLNTNLVFSQVAVDWAKAAVTEENGRIHAVHPNGGILVAASFDQPINLETSSTDYILTPTGGSDSYLMKLSSEGSIEWVLQADCEENDYARDIVVDNDGNVLLVGSFGGTMNFGNSPSISTDNPGGNGTYMVKVLANGQIDWAKSIDYAPNICTVDSINNIYIMGSYLSDSVDLDPGAGEHWVYSNETITGSEVLISQLDSVGNFIWGEVFEASGQDFKPSSVKVNSQGDICIVGHFKGDVDFDPGASSYTLSTPSLYDIFFLKLNESGQFLWAKQIGSGNPDYGQYLVLDHQDNWIVTGDFFEYSSGIMDFDPGSGTHIVASEGGRDSYILKLDANGSFQWVRTFGSTDHERGLCVATDGLGDIYATGYFGNTVDFDPGQGTNFLTENEGNPNEKYDAYLVKLDSDGNHVWAESIHSIEGLYVGLDNEQSVYVGGNYGQYYEPLILDPESSSLLFTAPQGLNNFFTAKYRQSGVTGRLYLDSDTDCILDSVESGLVNRLIMIQPGGYVAQTNQHGIWHVDSLATGNYTLFLDTSNGWTSSCAGPFQFTVNSTTSNTTVAPIGLINTTPCAKPVISVYAPFLRRCFSDQRVYVQSCNSFEASDVHTNSYIELELSPYMTPQASSLPYTNLGSGILHIETGDLQPGECTNFWIETEISCDANLNQTICLRAESFPLDSCMLDTVPAPLPEDFTPCSLPWDESSLELNGWCDNDSIRFSITNIGSDMICYSPYRLFVDGHYIMMDSVLLMDGETDSLAFLADGRTWRLEVDQHLLHPGNSQPSITIELCNNSGGWTPHLVATLPQNDFNPMVDIYCGTVSGSYDPNDKTGYPLGVGPAHLVEPNGQLDYVIRFQNTGTDTAFTVVVRDTLDTGLDIFSLESGVSSHPYSFRMYGQRVAEWTFNNIMLPDSTTDLQASQGFVTFKIDQQPNLSPGTEINNSADIYFDFNEPIITNTTSHIIATEPGRTELDTVELQGCLQVDFNGETYFSDGTYYILIEGSTDTMVVANVNIEDVSATIIEIDNALIGQVVHESVTFQWLNCDESFAPVIGENDSVYYPNQSGNYALEVTMSDCIDTSECVNVMLVGILYPNRPDIAIYPNPTSDKVRLELGMLEGEITVNLFNSVGKLLSTRNLFSVNATEIRLPIEAGFYLIQLVHSDGTITNFKVVKE